jgi:hypothetical protein
MVIAEVLVINRQSNEGYVSRLVQQIAGVFQCYLRILFDMSLGTGRTVSHIRRKHRFCTE